MPNSNEKKWREGAIRFIEYVVALIADCGGLFTGKPLVRLMLDDIRLLSLQLLDAVIKEQWKLSAELHRDIQELLFELSLLGD